MESSLPFIDEFRDPNMLHVGILRADIPRGSIENINTEGVSGNVGVFTHQDIPGANRLKAFEDEMPILSAGDIQYEGEPVLLVAVSDPDQLPEAVKQVKISYETDFSLLAFEPSAPDQVVDTLSITRGRETREYGDTARLVEARYRTALETHTNRGPLGAFVRMEAELIVVHTPTHWPEHVRETVAKVLDLPGTRVKVVQINPGPAYGEKVLYPSLLSAMAALVTFRTGRPSRLLLTPREVVEFTTKKAPVDVQRSSIIDENGVVLAEDIHIRFDVGAYPFFSREMLRRAVIASGSYYSIPDISITAEAIRTSSPPMNLYRGLGVSQSLFATEVHFSRLAEFSHLNPGDWKKKHAESRNIITGAHIPDMPLEKLIDHVMEKSDFYRKHSAYELTRKRRKSVKTGRRPLRGIGIAAGFTGNGFTEKQGNWGITAVLDRKDKLTIKCGTVTIPDTIREIWRRKAGEILGISPESVEIADGRDDSLPDSGPMMLAMPVSAYTLLVEKCCSYIRAQRFQQPLPIKVHRNIPAPRKTRWDGENMTGLPFHGLSWGAVVTEVELDPFTLIPEIRGVWAAFDCGLIFDENYAVSVAEGGIYEALAWSLGEEKLTPHFFQDYSIESQEQPNLRLPPVSVTFINKTKGLPGGITEIIESLVPAAFVTGLSQAAGFYFDCIPLTSETIHSYMEEPL